MSPHHIPHTISDRIALAVVKSLRAIADAFFVNRYGHRAVVLETVAGVPGMVGGMLRHLKSLRRMKDDRHIKTLLDEAENERMHLMTFIKIAQPTLLERLIVLAAQAIYFGLYALLYVFSPRTAHRVVGYMEEEAVKSYTHYLQEVENGQIENVPAPEIALKYWNMPPDSRLADLIKVIRADEMRHRDVNHCLSNEMEHSYDKAPKSCASH